jgi:hypothetical protein
VFAGDAFYAAAAVYDDPANSGTTHLRLARIARDGTAATALDALPGIDASYPQLIAAAGTGLRVVYTAKLPCGPYFGFFTQNVSVTGTALSDAVVIATSEGGWLWARPLALGGDTVVALLLGDSEALHVRRVRPDGSLAGPVHEIARGPAPTIGFGAITRRGPDAVVGWTRHNRSGVDLARMTP